MQHARETFAVLLFQVPVQTVLSAAFAVSFGSSSFCDVPCSLAGVTGQLPRITHLWNHQLVDEASKQGLLVARARAGRFYSRDS